MKSILKVSAIAALSLLITVSAFGRCCPTKSCAPKCETRCEVPCKLPQPECTTVRYRTECEGTPKYHWVCEKVYEACDGQVSEREKQVVEQCTGVYVNGQEGHTAPVKHKKKSMKY